MRVRRFWVGRLVDRREGVNVCIRCRMVFLLMLRHATWTRACFCFWGRVSAGRRTRHGGYTYYGITRVSRLSGLVAVMSPSHI